MKSVYISLLFLVTPILAYSCDEKSLTQSLTDFCSKMNSVEYEDFLNQEKNPNKNFIFESCGTNYIYTYSPEEPYILLRHPYRTYQNGNLRLIDKAKTSQNLAKKAIESKTVVSDVTSVGPKNLGIFKKMLALNCEVGSSKKNVIAVTSHLYTDAKPYISSLLFVLPDDKADVQIMEKILDANVPSDQRYLAAYVAYDEIMNFSRKIVASNFNIDPVSVDAIMKNDFNKIRAAEFVFERIKETDNPSVSDVQSAIMSFTEKVFFESPSLGRIVELEQLVQNLKNKKETLPQQATVEVKNQIMAAESDAFIYTLGAAVVFFITTLVLLIKLKMKRPRQ